MRGTEAPHGRAARLEGPLVCPACRAPDLRVSESGVVCGACGARYESEHGFPVLLRPGDERFDDAEDCCTFDAEEETNRHTATRYHLPLIRRLCGGVEGVRLLSAGCGVGADVDVFRRAGVDAYGVDCGRRSLSWARREAPSALHVGNVVALPYADDSFNVVTTGCLLPHIGVVGDTTVARPDAEAQRRQVAAELLRVTKPGGHILTGCPNRLCPVDLFHKGQMATPGGLARWHASDEAFLLSFADFRRLFVEHGGAREIAALPIRGYWGFHTKRRDPRMRLLVAALEAWFAVLSAPGLGLLRQSMLNPWLMLRVRK